MSNLYVLLKPCADHRHLDSSCYPFNFLHVSRPVCILPLAYSHSSQSDPSPLPTDNSSASDPSPLHADNSTASNPNLADVEANFDKFYEDEVTKFIGEMRTQFPSWNATSACDDVLKFNLCLIREHEFDFGIALAIDIFAIGLRAAYLHNVPDSIRATVAGECLKCYSQSLPSFTNLLLRLLQRRYDDLKPEWLAPRNMVRTTAYSSLRDVLEAAVDLGKPGQWAVVRGDPWTRVGDGEDHCWLPELIDMDDQELIYPRVLPILCQIRTHDHPDVSQTWSAYNLLRQHFRPLPNISHSKDLELIDQDPATIIPSTVIAVLNAVIVHLSELLEYSLSLRLDYGYIIPLLEYRDMREDLDHIFFSLMRDNSAGPALHSILERKHDLERLLLRCVQGTGRLVIPYTAQLDAVPWATLAISGHHLHDCTWLPFVEVEEEARAFLEEWSELD